MNLLNVRAQNPTLAIMGRTMTGEPFARHISDGPHWIVAGQTGSGKSVYVNGILLTMIYHAHPDELELIAIDPKKVEFGPWRGLPHMRIPPVTDVTDAYGLLKYLTTLMDIRYEYFENAGVRNLDEYNELVVSQDDRVSGKKHGYMRYIVCVIDEYADLVQVVPEVEDEIVRLAQKARAAGIHCLIATQRPSADILSPTIKANVPSIIGLRTVNGNNSQIIIGEPGLEKLLGKGDSQVVEQDGSMTRVQGSFTPNDNMYEIFDKIKETYGEAKEFDYKSVIVDMGLVDWADEYDANVPFDERHVKKKKKSGLGGMFG